MFIDAAGLQAALGNAPGPGEYDVLDAINMMERGDYSGAVRRITTALEAIVESSLTEELKKHYSEGEVAQRLEKSKNDFPGRVRQYIKLSKRQISKSLWSEIETTRSLRHAIVHRAARIRFVERGQAQRAVDTGRWAYNWFENNREREKVRETSLGIRSIGRHFTVAMFDAEIRADGVVVCNDQDE